jgi:hypothetical protein
MRRGILLLATMLMGFAYGDNRASPAANPFIGTWGVAEVDGVAASGTWTFNDDTVVIDYGTTFSGTYTYDATVSPSQVDLTITGQSTSLAIYRSLGPDVLSIKVQDGAATRATDFSVESGYDLLVLNRTRE